MKIYLDLGVRDDGRVCNTYDTQLHKYLTDKGYKPADLPLSKVFEISIRVQHDGTFIAKTESYDIDSQDYATIAYGRLFRLGKEVVYNETIFPISGTSWKQAYTTIPDEEHHNALKIKMLKEIIAQTQKNIEIAKRNLTWDENVVHKSESVLKSMGVNNEVL